MRQSVDSRLLIVRAGSLQVGLPLAHVVETLRPPTCALLPGTPDWVLGASLIRGRPTPVIDLSRLLTGVASARRRIVTLRAGARSAGLAVCEVLGLRELPASPRPELPPVLAQAEDVVSVLGVLDRELLLVLQAARVLAALPPESS